MDTRTIISTVLAQIGVGRRYRERYRPIPDADGVTFSFQISKYDLTPTELSQAPPPGTNGWPRETWILGDPKTYYFVPTDALAILCSVPSSYSHDEYDPNHRLIHINTQTHRCRYTGKEADFSRYYQAKLSDFSPRRPARHPDPERPRLPQT